VAEVVPVVQHDPGQDQEEAAVQNLDRHDLGGGTDGSRHRAVS
jgi:hypothetical protein